jgi:site-specific DNA recombinase
MMTQEAAAEAMRTYAEHAKQPNRQRHTFSQADHAELTEVKRAINNIVDAVQQQGGSTSSSLFDRLTELEVKQKMIQDRIARPAKPLPDIPPNMDEIYHRKLDRLVDALNQPEDRAVATDCLREIIDRITITPGSKRGVGYVTLDGELGTILEWLTAHKKDRGPAPKTRTLPT